VQSVGMRREGIDESPRGGRHTMLEDPVARVDGLERLMGADE